MHSLLFMIMSKGQLSGTLFTAYTLHSFTMLMQDIFKLYGFTMLVQAVILIPYAANAHHFHQTAKQIAIRIGDALVRSAPPGLPAVMLFCGFFSKFRLSKQDVEVTFPERLKLGADTSVVCFDKTGTLTGSVVSACLQLDVQCQHLPQMLSDADEPSLDCESVQQACSLHSFLDMKQNCTACSLHVKPCGHTTPRACWLLSI